jgi:hypothetical protein
MCTCFVEAVRPYAQGMISRYDDSHEPRAFGDGIQSLGVATMLVEAGGWPEADVEPMTRLHFHGLLNTLHAIATDKYRTADAQIYEDLPESNSTRMSDCLVTKARVLDAKVMEPFVADLVIDQTHSNRLWVTNKRDGKVTDIGDIPPTPAVLTIDASQTLVMPGQFTLARDWTPGLPLSEQELNRLLTHGTTTAICVVNLADREALDATAKPLSMPVNWVFVGNADELGKLKSDERLTCLALGAKNGVLAVISSGTDETLWRHVNEFGLTLLKRDLIEARLAASHHDAAKRSWTLANSLQLPRRGLINRDYLADLVFLTAPQPATAGGAIDWKQLDRVMVAGETVWEHGKRKGCDCGVQLLSRSGFLA